MKNFAVILYGPPGSGKGTQAKLLAEKLNLHHFDTGSFLRNIFYGKGKKSKEILEQKKKYEKGELVDTEWLLKMTGQKIKELAKLGYSLVFSGSPRNLLEAFGDNKKEGLLKSLEKFYGKENIKIFYLDIPIEESIKRNSKRTICSVCGSIFLSQISKSFKNNNKSIKIKNLSDCPFCGGKIIRRTDDNVKIIQNRLEQYGKNTYPALIEMQKRKYNVVKINGAPPPYKIFGKILSFFK